MRKVAFIGLIFLAFLLESRIFMFSTAPNLTAVITYYFGLKNGEIKGMLFGAFIGLLGDGLAGGIIGPNFLSKGIVGFLSSFMSGSFFRWTPVLGIIGVSALTALDGAIVFLSKTAFDYMPASPSHAISTILISAVMNTVFGAFLRPRND